MNNPNQPSWPWSCPRAQLRLSQQATSSIQVTLPTSRTQWLQLGMGGMGERAYSILHFKNKHHPSFREGPREKKKIKAPHLNIKGGAMSRRQMPKSSISAIGGAGAQLAPSVISGVHYAPIVLLLNSTLAPPAQDVLPS